MTFPSQRFLPLDVRAFSLKCISKCDHFKSNVYVKDYTKDHEDAYSHGDWLITWQNLKIRCCQKIIYTKRGGERERERERGEREREREHKDGQSLS